MNEFKYLWILGSLLVLFTDPTKGCIECRERENMCRPSIDWRENWIGKEVPVPGVKIESHPNEIPIPIPKVIIKDRDVPKHHDVPVQEIDTEEDPREVERIVKVPKPQIVKNPIEKIVDVPNVVEKVIRVPVKVRIPRKVIKIHCDYDVKEIHKPKPVLRVIKRPIPKPIGIPTPEIIKEPVHKNVTVHETTYKFCRNEDQPSWTPKPCEKGRCPKCKICPPCNGYKYKPPSSQWLDVPSNDQSSASEDTYEEVEYERK